MSKLFELIQHEAKRQYKSERSFYKEVGITQRAWEKYKSGETNFNDIKLSNFNRMMDLLFTPYEIMVVNEAIQATNLNFYENVLEAYHEIKLKHAKNFLDKGGKIEKETNSIETGGNKRKSQNKIKIVDTITPPFNNSITFQIEYPNTMSKDLHLHMPTGKKNRLEWFENEFPKVLVK